MGVCVCICVRVYLCACVCVCSFSISLALIYIFFYLSVVYVFCNPPLIIHLFIHIYTVYTDSGGFSKKKILCILFALFCSIPSTICMLVAYKRMLYNSDAVECYEASGNLEKDIIYYYYNIIKMLLWQCRMHV